MSSEMKNSNELGDLIPYLGPTVAAERGSYLSFAERKNKICVAYSQILQHI
jgi:hypothetical protein